MTKTILVVDDMESLRTMVKSYLTQEGFRVVTAANGREALFVTRDERPDLIILDLMMPELGGYDFISAYAREGNAPIIILTAKVEESDKVLGLELGADDYLTKPFNPRELVARVRAILRRAGAKTPTERPRRFGRVEIDPASREVTVDGEAVALRAKEFDLLLTLAEHANQVLSREQLLDRVWGYEFYGQTRTVDVHVAHLRDRLTGSGLEIETVWGRGYKLAAREGPAGEPNP